MLFAKKQMTVPKRVCFRMKELRESSGKTITELCEETKLSAQTITALEQCDFEQLPFSAMYKKQCIRRYAKALHMPADPLVQQFEQEENQESKEPFRFVPKATLIDKLHLRNIPMIFRSLLTVGTLLCLLAYLGVQIQHIITPPSLTLVSPDNGLLINASSIAVRGQTEQDTTVSVNGKLINFNEHGGFEETIELLPGLNTIVVSAQKKHGKSTKAVRYVVRKTEPHVSVK